MTKSQTKVNFNLSTQDNNAVLCVKNYELSNGCSLKCKESFD